jgi:hypothetical protein
LWEVATGRGRKPTHSPDKIKAIVRATLTTKPQGGVLPASQLDFC